MKLYTIMMVKSDGSIWSGFVSAQDTTAGGVTTPAATNAQNYAYAQAGAGAVLKNCSLCEPYYTA